MAVHTTDVFTDETILPGAITPLGLLEATELIFTLPRLYAGSLFVFIDSQGGTITGDLTAVEYMPTEHFDTWMTEDNNSIADITLQQRLLGQKTLIKRVRLVPNFSAPAKWALGVVPPS